MEEMEHITQKIDELLLSLETKGNHMIASLEEKGNEVTHDLKKKVTGAVRGIWIGIGGLIAGSILFMSDMNATVSAKATKDDLKEYPLTKDVLDVMKLDYMKDKDCFVVKDTTMMKVYEGRYMWQIESLLNQKK